MRGAWAKRPTSCRRRCTRWEDRARAQSEKAQSLTLRPENTAGVVRAYIEHKLGETGLLQKLYYIGPQFRRERPQKGRYRQFWQIGAEVIGPPSAGSESPLRDAEVLEMLASLSRRTGHRRLALEINSVGSATDRLRYIAALREALAPVKTQDVRGQPAARGDQSAARARLQGPEDQEIIESCRRSPTISTTTSKAHFAAVLAALDACDVTYELNPRLVRGLDYYTRTTFEFTHGGLGAQNALLGGGRYDGLSEMLGGPKAPGIGFAMGEDRLILTLQAQRKPAACSARGCIYRTSQRTLNRCCAGVGAGTAPRRSAGRAGRWWFRLKKSFEIGNKLARKIVLLGEDE